MNPDEANPYIRAVPERFNRYRHGSHQHRLFLGIVTGSSQHFCNGCRRLMLSQATIFRCPRCDYDLCQRCFSCAPYQEVDLAASDDDEERRLDVFDDINVYDRRSQSSNEFDELSGFSDPDNEVDVIENGVNRSPPEEDDEEDENDGKEQER